MQRDQTDRITRFCDCHNVAPKVLSSDHRIRKHQLFLVHELSPEILKKILNESLDSVVSRAR